MSAEVPHSDLRTARLLLVSLADHHLDLEIQRDSDPEVLPYLGGRARSAAELAESHARMTLGRPGRWPGFTQ
ncbi:MAG TPA: hypothetical protein VN969_15920 [Streptosporangiaceae bacterium]|nr:hypothetical protein [Streptosporangiaceae bacterium]